MAVITVYCFDPVSGEITGTDLAHENPMQPGQFLLPRNSTNIAPPAPQAGKMRVFKNGSWSFEDIPIVVIPEKSPEQKAFEARAQRNTLLVKSDWTRLDDVPAWVNKPAWATYRQALRDVPQQAGFPNDITWPTEPPRT